MRWIYILTVNDSRNETTWEKDVDLPFPPAIGQKITFVADEHSTIGTSVRCVNTPHVLVMNDACGHVHVSCDPVHGCEPLLLDKRGWTDVAI